MLLTYLGQADLVHTMIFNCAVIIIFTSVDTFPTFTKSWTAVFVKITMRGFSEKDAFVIKASTSFIVAVKFVLAFFHAGRINTSSSLNFAIFIFQAFHFIASIIDTVILCFVFTIFFVITRFISAAIPKAFIISWTIWIFATSLCITIVAISANFSKPAITRYSA